MSGTAKPLRRTKKDLLTNAPICRQIDQLPAACDPEGWEGIYTSEIPEISIVLSGSGFHRVLEQAIPCRPGDVFITRPDVPHGFFASDCETALTLQHLWFDPTDWFTGELADGDHPRYCCGVFSDSALIACATLTEKAKSELLSGLEGVMDEISEKQDQWQNAVSARLTLLLISVERYMGDAIKSAAVVRSRQWGLVSRALNRISTDFQDPALTLHTIAASLCVSPGHLSRLFRKLTGKGFSDYLRGIRMEQACRLLKETDLSVEQVMQGCGMRDLPSFYKSFHSYTGITPSRYRTDAGGNQQGGTIMVILSEISEYLQKGRWKQVKELVQQALDEGADPQQILNEGLLSGMQVIGELFKNNDVYIPEVLVAARAMNVGVQVLKPHLAGNGSAAAGRVCIGTVQGDLHDIGKNLVKMMLEGKGLEVIDLGTDVAPETFVHTAIEQECDVICCSALLTTTMGVMADVVKAAEAAGIRDKVKIMVGGAPITEEFCRKIGADVYTSDAASAADAAVELCRK